MSQNSQEKNLYQGLFLIKASNFIKRDSEIAFL